MRYLFKATIDGSLPLSDQVKANSEEEAREKAFDRIVSAARARGHNVSRSDVKMVEVKPYTMRGDG